MITHEQLHQVLHYDPATGVFTWKSLPEGLGRNQMREGDRAGWIDTSQGYRYIEINRQTYRAARLAWFYMTGKWPKKIVDHKDRDRANDSWENLRQCSRPENGANMSLRSDNTSGVRGVNWNKAQQKWHARIMWQQSSIHLGFFVDLEEAKRVREERASQLYGEFNSDLN